MQLDSDSLAVCVCTVVGNKREKGSDEFGSLPVDHRLSAVFTLTALSPQAPNREELLARDQYPVRSTFEMTAKGLMREGQNAEARARQQWKRVKQS